jgi:hypothetical protein
VVLPWQLAVDYAGAAAGAGAGTETDAEAEDLVTMLEAEFQGGAQRLVILWPSKKRPVVSHI